MNHACFHNLRRCTRWQSLQYFLGMLPFAACLAGCDHAPEFNIVGSYFPAWLLCMAAGTALSGLSYLGLKRLGVDREIVASIVVYPSLALFYACALWLLLFR